MLDQHLGMGQFALGELEYLRAEAMDLFERCLTEGTAEVMTAFLEEQITHDPPRLDLLSDIAEDLHQRLLSLREYHFDVRDRVVRLLRNDFQVDLTRLSQPSALAEYHLLELDGLLQSVGFENPDLSNRDLDLLRKVLETSLEMAHQLHEDVHMTEQLLEFVLDWVDGLGIHAIRRSWFNDWESPTAAFLH